jgi:hypothetical protein
MLVVHNPNAGNPIPVGFLPSHAEYVADPVDDEFVLRKVGAKDLSYGHNK